MAKMVGRKGMEHWHCKCCGGPIAKKTVITREEREWRKETDEELAHGQGFCGKYDCPECGADEDFDFNPPEDLEGIPNVLYNGKEPPKIDFSTL